jgi:SAM-dependent methyltransferase
MRCPGCGRADGERRHEVGDRLFRTTPHRFWVSGCRACGLEFLDPTPAAAEIASFYPPGYWTAAPAADAPGRLWMACAEAYRRLALRDHVRFTRRAIREQQAAGSWRGLLDVGCGDGSFLAALGVRPAIGLDLSRAAAAGVHARGWNAACGTLERAPFAEETFSVVTMFHYLEHVLPASASLDAVRRLLAPGGRLIVQVPNRDCWQRRLLGSHWAGYEPPRHLVHYSTRTLRATLQAHGFEVERVTCASLRDNAATFALSVAPGLYPPARRARRDGADGAAGRWLASLAYLALVAAATPFALLEAACGYGAAVTMLARPRR